MSLKSGHCAGNFLLRRVPTGSNPRDFFAAYAIDAGDEAVLNTAARDDARRYTYNAIVSFLSGVESVHQQHSAWAATKMYYTAFYVGRAALCRSNRVIFHVPKNATDSFTQYEILISNGAHAEIVRKLPSTHKLVATRFREVGYPSFMRSLQIDGADPLIWLMQQREYWQYRAGRFADPDLPTTLDQIDTKRAAQLLMQYESDSSGVYLADPAHALIALPFRLLTWALSQDTLVSDGIIDEDDIKFLQKMCRVAGKS